MLGEGARRGLPSGCWGAGSPVAMHSRSSPRLGWPHRCSVAALVPAEPAPAAGTGQRCLPRAEHKAGSEELQKHGPRLPCAAPSREVPAVI